MVKLNSTTLPAIIAALLFLVSCNNGKNDLADKHLEEIVSNVAAPFVAVPNQGRGVAFQLNSQEIKRMRSLKHTQLRLQLSEIDTMTLELERRPLPLAAEAKLVIDGIEMLGGIRTLVKDLQIWEGPLVGMPGSNAYLTLTETAAFGLIKLSSQPGGHLHITSDSEKAGQVRIVSDGELDALGFKPPDDFCLTLPAPDQRPSLSSVPTDDPSSPGFSLERVVTLAIETDHELFRKFLLSTGGHSRSRSNDSLSAPLQIPDLAGAAVALAEYVTALIGAASNPFRSAIGTELLINYLGLHTSEATDYDGYTQFKDAWEQNGWPVEAAVAHLLSGQPGGGQATISSLCDQSSSFSVSWGIGGGNIDCLGLGLCQALGNFGLFKWDVFVVAHELGHNFGSLHTLEAAQYYPPIDQCFLGCAVPTAGTIMSYCYWCPGGLDNIALVFHERTADIMREVVDAASCVGNVGNTPGGHVRPSCTRDADCSDGVSCTIDSCDPAFGCSHTDSCGANQMCSVPQNSCVPTTTLCFQQEGLPDSEYNGATDTTIEKRRPPGYWGSRRHLKVGATPPSHISPGTAALLHWDLSVIPSQARVRSAELTLWAYCCGVSDYESQHRYPIYEVSRRWVESEASWTQASALDSWEVAGALGSLDHDSTAIATIKIHRQDVAFTVPLARNTVQGWVSSPASNLGIIIQDPSSTDDLSISSSENFINQRPKLCVTYTP